MKWWCGRLSVTPSSPTSTLVPKTNGLNQRRTLNCKFQLSSTPRLLLAPKHSHAYHLKHWALKVIQHLPRSKNNCVVDKKLSRRLKTSDPLELRKKPWGKRNAKRKNPNNKTTHLILIQKGETIQAKSTNLLNKDIPGKENTKIHIVLFNSFIKGG